MQIQPVNNFYKLKTKKMKKLFLLTLTICLILSVNAQSPFRPLPRPENDKSKFSLGTTTVPTATAWRFTAPMAGMLFTKGNSQIVTALGFGWNSLVWDTSGVGSWYTKVSVNGIILGGGNVAPNPSNPASILSVGFSIGLLKQHIQFGPVYNIPAGGTSTAIGKNLGVFAAVSMPLN